MGYYEHSREWSRLDSLVRNRVKVINEVTEDRATYRYWRGECTVTFLGRVLASYPTTGLEGVSEAYQRLDAVYRVLWDCRREGLVYFA